ncbi:hypothetical protein [Pontibacter akesuensis]|nr:hypothetical protein [Pontibacter akesuensis]GHA81237.1 hypothetical protein GCM10007389_39660 [Pontibacter akesuensis]
MEVRNTFGKPIHEIEYVEEMDIVEATWFSAASKKEIKQALSLSLMVHEQMHCSYRLDDITKLAVQRADVRTWLQKAWLPLACRAGIAYVAYIDDLSSFGEAAGEANHAGCIGSLVEVRFFTDRESGLNWLKSNQTAGL